VIVAIAETDGGTVIVNTGKHGRILGFTGEGTLLWDTPVGMHDNDRLEAFEGELQVLPGMIGGVNTPIAIADGIIYATVVNAPTQYARPDGGTENWDLGIFDSQMVAVDAATGQILWDVILPGDSFGAATVIDDLVLTSLLDGRILALDRTDGRLIWEYQASGGINGWPAVVGDYLLVPVGLGDTPHLLAPKTSSS
jgi:alcohol dehydrogenase (cytochrome c)